jgi:ABC-type glycerol-3-phosphate transport system substrate-binding protein
MPDDDSPDTNDENTSRRDVLKATSAMTAAGAMGALAGCTGGGDGGDGGGDGGDGGSDGGDGGSDGGDGGSDGGDGGDGGGSETLQISYLSAEAAENSLTTPQFEKSIGRFEEQQGNVEVRLQTASYGDIKQQISSRVSGGNPPTLAEFGSAGIELWDNGDVPDHAPWVEASEVFPDGWSEAGRQTAEFRGNYWNGSSMRHSVSNLGIRPKMYSQAGVTDPFEELSTWSGFWEATTRVAEEFPDAFAYEKTGVYNDLEDYWGEARTAHTEGEDPWIRGDPTDPDVQVGNNPSTDGMIEHTLALAQEFSSPESASRGDEEIPSLMLTGRVGSFTYMTQNFTRWYQTKDDAVIGWDGGDGDVMLLPNPQLANPGDLASMLQDRDYGYVENLGEATEGEHGGHVWALEQAQGMFEGHSQAEQDAAWALHTFFLRDEQHVIEEYGETYPSIPNNPDLQQVLLDELGDDLPQNFAQVLENLDEYGAQYGNTGGPWDVWGTDQIRWTDVNETISQAIAGQIQGSNLVSEVQSRVQTTLDEQNS